MRKSLFTEAQVIGILKIRLSTTLRDHIKLCGMNAGFDGVGFEEPRHSQ